MFCSRTLIRAARLLLLCPLCALLPAQGGALGAQEEDTADARSLYKSALSSLERRRFADVDVALQQLGEHPLAAWLEYRKLRRNFRQTTPEQILAFRARHQPAQFAEQLFNEWLAYLRRRADWKTLARYYEPQASAEMQCAYMRALYNAGEKDRAFAEAPGLWVVNKSQHEECDPIFDVWLSAKRYTQAQVWDRLALVYTAGRRSLGNYLKRFVAKDGQAMARELDRVHRRPSRLTSTSRYSQDRLATRRVVMHGLARMTPGNPQTAVSLWTHYRGSLSFTEEERQRVERGLLLELARIDRTRLIAPAGELPLGEDARVFREVTLSLMRQGAWEAVFDRLTAVPPDLLGEDTWRYWLWRSANSHGALAPEDVRIAEEAAAALANERGYYGFLMATWLGEDLHYGHKPITLGEAELARLASVPAAARIIELLLVGEESAARRELAHVSSRLPPSDARILLKRVSELGWMSEAMINAMRGGAQDDLNLRFPLAYQHLYRQAATRTGVPLPLLLGLSRQESLFRIDARSAAGARGLMQLMPATAREVARRLGKPQPRSADLLQPILNIELGSRYLADRLAETEGNRALAAAAYNGGPRNLQKWLAAYSEQPLDIFIESIRFRETREYVKLILSFSAIYAWKLDRETPFLNASEVAFGGGLFPVATAASLSSRPYADVPPADVPLDS